MRVERFEWGEDAAATAAEVRAWKRKMLKKVDVVDIWHRVAGAKGGRDQAIVDMTNEYDATESSITQLKVDADEAAMALDEVEASLRHSMELATANIREVASRQLAAQSELVTLDQGQKVTIRDVPVGAAGIYAPGGKAPYPSTVLMCAIPAQVAEVPRIALASPPGANGQIDSNVLAAAALCGIDEIYAMGGAQAIIGLAEGTETIEPVDIIAGPGNEWVRDAKLLMYSFGVIGIDSPAGPSELMVVAGHDANVDWIALDLCAQAEHGDDSPLIVAAVERHVLDAIEEATRLVAKERPSVADAPLALVAVPDADAAIDLANAYAPEHLELIEEDAAQLADRVTTAGCVFVGRYGATAFGDYVVGSNHVLPTRGAGRFSGPLGPGVFRRRISTVEIPADAAAKLAPHVDRIARAEGFPVHGESAMIRSETDE